MPPKNERTKLEVTSERAVLAAVRLPDSRYDVQDPNLLSHLSTGTSGIYSGTVGSLTIRLSSDGPDGVQGTADDVALTLTVSELRGALVAAGIQID